MIISEKDIQNFLKNHLKPSTFEINSNEVWRKEVEGEARISYYPSLTNKELSSLIIKEDNFRGQEDMKFPIKYYKRNEKIEEITYIFYKSLSQNTSIQFKRLNEYYFKIEIRKLSINSFKEIVQYCNNKAEIKYLLCYLK